MSSWIKTALFVTTVVSFSLMVFPAAADLEQLDCRTVGGVACAEGGSGEETARLIRGRIINIVNILLSFVGLLAAIMLVYGGLVYITSGGDEDRASKGKRIILYAIIGIIIIGVSALVVNFIITAIQGGNQGGGGNPGGGAGAR